MNCEVCDLPSDGETCGRVCAALKLMAWLQAKSDEDGRELYPNMLNDERAQLQWDFRRRWHEVRELPFHEPPPKTAAMRELERLDMLRSA